jgi:ATP-binding cassette subfamily C (CFTR/MRP) protein 10
MAEILRGIRQIKSYAWEGALAGQVAAARRRELSCLAVKKYLDALCVYCWAVTPPLFSCATFGALAALGVPLTARSVFTALALFNVLLAPINSFPWVVNG